MTKLAMKSSDKKCESEVDKMSKMEKQHFLGMCKMVPYSQIQTQDLRFFQKLSTVLQSAKSL